MNGNYIRSCELVIADLENHAKQCHQELEHHKKMVEFSEKQLDIAMTRYRHEVEALETIKREYGMV